MEPQNDGDFREGESAAKANAQPFPSGNCRLFFPGDEESLAEFLKPPPKKIGPLISAHTDLLTTHKHLSFWMRLAIASVTGILLPVVIAGVVMNGLGIGVQVFIAGMLSIFLFPVSIAFSTYFFRFHHYTGYVGELGAAYFTCTGSRNKLDGRSILLYSEAEEVRVELIDVYLNSAYSNTNFDFIWRDDSGALLYRIKGSHEAGEKSPPNENRFHLATLVEEGWNNHLLERILPILRAGNTYTFRLKGQNGIECGPESLILRLQGKVQTFYPIDLRGVRVQQGSISLEEPGAKEGWFTSEGIHTFSFKDLANARIFLMLLQRYYDIPVK